MREQQGGLIIHIAPSRASGGFLRRGVSGQQARHRGLANATRMEERLNGIRSASFTPASATPHPEEPAVPPSQEQRAKMMQRRTSRRLRLCRQPPAHLRLGHHPDATCSNATETRWDRRGLPISDCRFWIAGPELYRRGLENWQSKSQSESPGAGERRRAFGVRVAASG